MSAEGGEEVGEEGSVGGWHCCGLRRVRVEGLLWGVTAEAEASGREVNGCWRLDVEAMSGQPCFSILISVGQLAFDVEGG